MPLDKDSNMHVIRTSAQWEEREVQYWAVPRGCLCVELVNPKLTKIKVGEGNKYYSQLPYIGELSDLSNYYTKEETDNIINNLEFMSVRSTQQYPNKESLPKTGNDLGDVRFVKSPDPKVKTDPDTYLWNGTEWILVGNPLQEIDLSKYVLKSEFEPVRDRVNEMYPKMHDHDNKSILDRIEQPFTTDDKTKLDSLKNYEPFVGTDGYITGKEGLVPTPKTEDYGKYLSSDGKWEPLNPATTETIGGIIVGDNLSITSDGVLSANGSIDDIYTKLVDPNQFTLLHTKPLDWDTNWGRYFRLSYDRLEEEPMHFDPTKHYKYDGNNYIPGTPGDTYDAYQWYDMHYNALRADVEQPFYVDEFYTGDIAPLVDGEPLDVSFGKINDAIQHIRAVRQNALYINQVAPVALSGNYGDLTIKPSVNGITIEGSHPSMYYNIAKTYMKTTAEWDETPELISENNVLYIYTDYYAEDGIPGCKLGDGVTPVQDLPVFNGCKVTDEDIENWNDKVGAVMVPTDRERLFLYRNKGDVR